MTENLMLACCGLDCGSCEIRLAPSDARAANVVVEWFQSQGWLKPEEGLPQIIERKMYCTGCLGDRAVHWSADCWILACCVGQNHLLNCAECGQFPCQRLTDWSTQNSGYQAAFTRLQQIHQGLSHGV